MYINFNYNNFSKDIEQNVDFIGGYSNDPEKLSEIISGIVEVSCFLSHAPAPWDDTLDIRLKSIVEINYKGRETVFQFWHSMHNTEEFKQDELDSKFLGHVLYDILCTIKSESGTHNLSLEEFCSEFYYDKYSRETYNTYKNRCEFSRRIDHIFSHDELESFPS